MRAALSLTALALLLAGCTSSGSDVVPPTPTGPAFVQGAFRCPDRHARAASDDASATLPTGANAAVLCPRDNNTPWAPPRGRLTSGLDRLVGVVNEQKVYHPTPDTACGGIGAPAWFLVFRYADGVRTISGDNGGCWDLLVGPTQRYGSRHVYQAYLWALLRQRHTHGPPKTQWRAPSCPDGPPPYGNTPTLGPIADPRHLVAATWCRRVHGRWQTAEVLTAFQRAVIRRDVATSGARLKRRPFQPHCQGPPRTTSGLLVGRDAWGDSVAMSFACDTYTFFLPARRRSSEVRMLPATAAVVASLNTH